MPATDGGKGPERHVKSAPRDRCYSGAQDSVPCETTYYGVFRETGYCCACSAQRWRLCVFGRTDDALEALSEGRRIDPREALPSAVRSQCGSSPASSFAAMNSTSLWHGRTREEVVPWVVTCSCTSSISPVSMAVSIFVTDGTRTLTHC